MAKKMIDSSKLFVKACNIIPEQIDAVSSLVRGFVRYNERKDVTDNEDFKKAVEAFETAHVGVDFYTAKVEDIRATFATDKTVDVDEIIEMRDKVADIDAEGLDLKKSFEDFNALSRTDKLFVTLQCHRVYPKITLDNWIIDGKVSVDGVGEKEIDVKGLVEDYYTGKITLGQARQNLCALYNRACGDGGSLFYGIKVKKSALSAENTKHFFAEFHKAPSLKGSEKKGFKYQYGLKTMSDNQLKALTNLLSVFLFDSNNYTVKYPVELTGEVADVSATVETVNTENVEAEAVA